MGAILIWQKLYLMAGNNAWRPEDFQARAGPDEVSCLLFLGTGDWLGVAQLGLSSAACAGQGGAALRAPLHSCPGSQLLFLLNIMVYLSLFSNRGVLV